MAVVYFAVRTCRLRQRRRSGGRRTGSRKYQPLGINGGSHEMEPLGDGGEDDEDEDTLFETSQPGGTGKPTLQSAT